MTNQTRSVTIDAGQLDLALENLMPDRSRIETALKGIVKSVIEQAYADGVKQVTTKIELRGPETHKDVEGLFHSQFEQVYRAIRCGNVMLVGPAGSGKTHLATQIAQALGVEFYFTGAINAEYKLTGFINAQGQIVNTDFRRAYENGGLFLFDEYDASLPAATLPFNAALSNDWMDFPDQRVKRHKDFYCMASANTFGRGADRLYVGRNSMDAASLDRFLVIDFDYDDSLEFALAGNRDWVTKIQHIRRIISELAIRHVVSPRASIMGARLLEAGASIQEAMDAVVWKGLDRSTRSNIESRLI